MELEPRVTDGLCPERCTTPSRITVAYKEGRGDLTVYVEDTQEGYYKDLLYTELEYIRHTILECEGYVTDPYTLEVCEWLQEVLYCISGSLHLIDEESEYADLYSVSEEEVKGMEGAIAVWKNKLGNRQEFCHYRVKIVQGRDASKGARALDKCRSDVRKAHTVYRRWRSYHGQTSKFAKNLKALGKFLNRLSSVLFWAAANEAKANGVEPTYWSKKLPSFPSASESMQSR